MNRNLFIAATALTLVAAFALVTSTSRDARAFANGHDAGHVNVANGHDAGH